jgi:hypothetical protein
VPLRKLLVVIQGHHSVCLEERPFVAGAQHGARLASQLRHAGEAVYYQAGAGVVAIGGIDKVAGIEQIPLPINVLKRVRVDGKLAVGHRQRGYFRVGSLRLGAGGHVQLVAHAGGDGPAAPRVVHVERAVVQHHFGCPKLCPLSTGRRRECPADWPPVHQVFGKQQIKNPAIGRVALACGAEGVVLAAVAQHKRVGKIAGHNRVGVGVGSGGSWVQAHSQ